MVKPGGDIGKYATHGWRFLGTQVETDFLRTWALRDEKHLKKKTV
jgi:hypothetical protein